VRHGRALWRHRDGYVGTHRLPVGSGPRPLMVRTPVLYARVTRAALLAALARRSIDVTCRATNTMELGGFSSVRQRDLAFYASLEVKGDSR
jgi:hypothetical protein